MKSEQIGTFFSGGAIYRHYCPVCQHPYLGSGEDRVEEFDKKRCLKCILARLEALENQPSVGL